MKFFKRYKDIFPTPAANKMTLFFNAEVPRSRSYGHTAALRLIVQPCDEDD
jgi:hypothetical protein